MKLKTQSDIPADWPRLTNGKMKTKELVRKFESQYGRILSGNITVLLPLVELHAKIQTEHTEISLIWSRDSLTWPTVPEAFRKLMLMHII